MSGRANVRMRAGFLLVGCGCVLGGCVPPSSRGAMGEPSPGPATAASTDASPTVVRPDPVAPRFCVPNNRQVTWLDDAWPDGDRVVVCVAPPPGTPPEDAAPPSCLSVGTAGDYRAEARRAGRAGPTKPPLRSVPFRRVSVDGLLAFELDGGRRSPHRAVGTLREARTQRVLKRAPVEYDEHLEFLGWIGRGVVLRMRVDEGPGCRLFLLDPTKSWPTRDEIGTDIGDCYLDDASADKGVFEGHLVLQPGDGVVAIVDAGGDKIAFVDEATLAISVLKMNTGAGPEEGKRFVAWLEGDSTLVIAYGAPSAGDVARIDLKRRTLGAAWSAPVCER